MQNNERDLRRWTIAGAAIIFGGYVLKGLTQESSRARRSRRLQAEIFQDSRPELTAGSQDVPRKIGNLFIPAPAFVASVRQNPYGTAAILRTVFSQAPESNT